MKKIVLALFSLTLVVLSSAVNSAPINLTLVKHNQVSTTAVSTLVWKSCPPPVPPATTYAAPCIDPANAWVIANNVTTSNATWTWDSATGVLASSGLYWSTSYITSNPQGLSVISDRVENLAIDTVNQVTTATNYVCVEGAFLSGVNANGCGGYDFGLNGVDNSSMAYNVVSVDSFPNPDPYCIVRTIGGDDEAGPSDTSRGVNDTFGLTPGCDPNSGAFVLYTILQDNTLTGGQLQISNGTPISCPPPAATNCAAGANWMTFAPAPTAVADGPVDAGIGGATPIAVMANDLFYTNNVTVTVTTPPTKGAAVVSGSPGPQAGISIGYTPNVGATGTDSFVYTAVDGNGVTSDSATVSITILQFGANPDSVTTVRNTPIGINVGGNDLGFATPVTITITTPPNQGGTATPPAPGAPAGQVVSYTPATTAAGTPTYTETFTYQITDGTVTDSAVVTVTVSNTVPDARNGAVTISTQGFTPAGRTGSFTAPGAGGSLGNSGTVAVTVQGTKGTATNAGNVMTYTVTDAIFFYGTDTFTYTITDADGETDSADVTVTIPDVAPTLANGSIVTTAGTAATTTLATTLGNGTSAQNVRTVGAATGGTCVLSTLSATGTSVTYTPNAGFSGGDSCVVTIRDEGGAGPPVTATLSITVNAAGGGGGGGGGGPQLPPASGSFDLWGLSILAGALWLRRKRRGSVAG
ncbi:MAG: Ig-like domain-containing protein [Gammaproteobacteria bacterium]|nr:Ig-like domain-containing protein [Gammaproteobacteria bacterium]